MLKFAQDAIPYNRATYHSAEENSQKTLFTYGNAHSNNLPFSNTYMLQWLIYFVGCLPFSSIYMLQF